MTTDQLTTRPRAKTFDTPDQVTRRFGDMGQLDIIQLGETTAVRATFQPGFHWLEHVKPVVGTDLCQARHVGYVISGRALVRLADGSEGEVKAGDVFDIPPGHDVWVVGDDAYVTVDFTAAPQLTDRRRSARTTPPDHHRVLLDNDDVRVLEVRIPAGGTSGRHSHPKSVVYQLSETRVRMSSPDGASRELELKPGQITWTPGMEHTVENLGPDDDWGVIVELKE